jgi:hypothetical protein
LVPGAGTRSRYSSPLSIDQVDADELDAEIAESVEQAVELCLVCERSGQRAFARKRRPGRPPASPLHHRRSLVVDDRVDLGRRDHDFVASPIRSVSAS